MGTQPSPQQGCMWGASYVPQGSDLESGSPWLTEPRCGSKSHVLAGWLQSHPEPRVTLFIFPEHKDLSGAHHLEKVLTKKSVGKNGMSTSPWPKNKKTASIILVLEALSIATDM